MVIGPAIPLLFGALIPVGWLVDAGPEYQYIVLCFSLNGVRSLVAKSLGTLSSIAQSSIAMAGGSVALLELYQMLQSKPVRLGLVYFLPGILALSGFLALLPSSDKPYFNRLLLQINAVVFCILEVAFIVAVILIRKHAERAISEYAIINKQRKDLNVITVHVSELKFGAENAASDLSNSMQPQTDRGIPESLERRLILIQWISLMQVHFITSFAFGSAYYAATVFVIPEMPLLGIPMLVIIFATGWSILPLVCVFLLFGKKVPWAMQLVDPVGLDTVSERENAKPVSEIHQI
jgi:hypothetical protein